MSAIKLVRRDRIAELRLCNIAKGNALNVGMLAQLAAHLENMERDGSIAAVMISAEGEHAFCTGADINDWCNRGPADFARHWVRDGQRILDRLARLSKQTAAVLQGHAFGGGLELAAACDIRTMAPNATLALPETRLGIVPGWSGTHRLARLMPEPLVKEMVLFGRRITADRALACGFVAAVDQEPRATAENLLRRAVALSPRAVETAKSMIHAAQGEDRGTMVEMLGSAAIFASPDREEGIAAFLEKREARFRGE